MKKKEQITTQLELSLDFTETIAVNLSSSNSITSTEVKTGKLISLDYYKKEKEKELFRKFYSLSDHLDLR